MINNNSPHSYTPVAWLDRSGLSLAFAKIEAVLIRNTKTVEKMKVIVEASTTKSKST